MYSAQRDPSVPHSQRSTTSINTAPPMPSTQNRSPSRNILHSASLDTSAVGARYGASASHHENNYQADQVGLPTAAAFTNTYKVANYNGSRPVPLSPERESLVLDIEGLAKGIAKRDAAIASLNNEMHLIREDYGHNYNLLQSQGEELDQLRKLLAIRDDELLALEGRCAAQTQKIEGNQEDLTRYTSALQAKAEALAAQLSVMTTERLNIERQNNDREMEIASLRREIQQMQAKHVRALQANRLDAQGESEQQLLQREREVRNREDALQRQVLGYEHNILQLRSERDRQKDDMRTLQISVDESMRTVAAKDTIIEQLQIKIGEMKRSSAALKADFESEALAMATNKSTYDKSIVSTHHMLRRELEQKSAELDVKEQKMSSMKSSHENEARRWMEERSAQVALFEDKYKVLADRAVVADSKALTAHDEISRLKRQLADMKGRAEALEAANSNLLDQKDESEHRLALREQELSRATHTSKRLRDDLVEVNKTKEFLLTESDRRDWTSRSRTEVSQRLQSAQWRSPDSDSYFIAGNGEVGTGIGEGEPSLIGASAVRGKNIGQVGANRRNSVGGADHEQVDTTAIQMLQDIKDMLGHSSTTATTELQTARAQASKAPKQQGRHSRSSSRNRSSSSDSSSSSSLREKRRSRSSSKGHHTTRTKDAEVAKELKHMREEREWERMQAEKQVMLLEQASERSRRHIEQLKAANATLNRERSFADADYQNQQEREEDGGRASGRLSPSQRAAAESILSRGQYGNPYRGGHLNQSSSQMDASTIGSRSVGFKDGARPLDTTINMSTSSSVNQPTINSSRQYGIPLRGGSGEASSSQRLSPQAYANANSAPPHRFASTQRPSSRHFAVDTTTSALKSIRIGDAQREAVLDNLYHVQQQAGVLDISTGGMSGGGQQQDHHNASMRNKRKPFQA